MKGSFCGDVQRAALTCGGAPYLTLAMNTAPSNAKAVHRAQVFTCAASAEAAAFADRKVLGAR